MREAINSILWNQRESKERYSLLVLDRFDGIIEIPLREVERVDRGYIYFRDPPGKFIPIHRVRAILKDGEIVWSRRKST